MAGEDSGGVAFFAGFDGDGKAVVFRGQRAGGEGGVGAGRVLDAVEVEDQIARFVEAVIGKRRIENASADVSGGFEGQVAEDEEQSFAGRVFQNRLECEFPVAEGEGGDAGRGKVDGGAEDGGDSQGLRGREGGPGGLNAEIGVGGEPVEAVEGSAGGRVGVLDAQHEAATAVEHGQGEAAEGHDGGFGAGGEWTFLGGLAVNQQIGEKPSTVAMSWTVLPLTMRSPK